VRALYPDAASFADRTGRGPARPGELRDLLRAVRADGYATEDGEVTLGLRSVGVPVLDHAGWPIAAIAVTYPDDAAKDATDLARLIDPVVGELGRRIGGPPR
jgi:DNA-binding IclR family transcriptional regulator